MKKGQEFAVIFKVGIKDNSIEYTPKDIIIGYYDDEEKAFIDNSGTAYYHIIDIPENYGYACRSDISMLTKSYPLVPFPLAKKIILNSLKKSKYVLGNEEKTSTPVIIMTDKKTNNIEVLLENDVLNFYEEVYPNFIEEFREKDKETNIEQNEETKNTNIEINIANLYKEITENVIDQDEPIRKILTAIWKQYNDFSPNKSRNIFINGGTAVGKTETFRILTKLINVPCVMTSATEYTANGYVGKSVTDMLVSMLDRAGGDLEKAQKGILIIDEIDKIASQGTSSSQVNQRDVQEALLKLIEDGKFDITYHNKEYTFDTSKLMVVAMGSFSRIELKEDKVVGFEQKAKNKTYKDLTREDFIANGMIPELIGRFPVIVQMNELGYNSFIRILKESKHNALNLNKNFFESQGIKLSLSDEVIDAIANKAVKDKFGARSLDETIETALSVASFEIASNPDLYDELVITTDTIKDNKNYKLIRKK